MSPTKWSFEQEGKADVHTANNIGQITNDTFGLHGYKQAPSEGSRMRNLSFTDFYLSSCKQINAEYRPPHAFFHRVSIEQSCCSLMFTSLMQHIFYDYGKTTVSFKAH